jgi:hypothetical protein
MSLTTKPSKRGPLHEEAVLAMREAVWDVIQEHKRLGLPLVIWREGKVVKLPAEQAEVEYLAAKAHADAARSNGTSS